MKVERAWLTDPCPRLFRAVEWPATLARARESALEGTAGSVRSWPARKAANPLIGGPRPSSCARRCARSKPKPAGLDALSAASSMTGSATPSSPRSRRSARPSGRVIVTGMGKSGHIGRKIAATFASTGTPAYFVHPGEASHGDLGMITPRRRHRRALVVGRDRSNSRDLIEYAKRFRVALIAVTANAKSTLAQAADVHRSCSPAAREACPLGLAPTTSTLIQLALGDALAVALFESRGFTALDFKASASRRPARRQPHLRARRDASRDTSCRWWRDGTRMTEAIVEMTVQGLRLRRRHRRGGHADRHHHRRRPAPAHARRIFSPRRSTR